MVAHMGEGFDSPLRSNTQPPHMKYVYPALFALSLAYISLADISAWKIGVAAGICVFAYLEANVKRC